MAISLLSKRPNFSEGFAFVSTHGLIWDFIDVKGKSIAVMQGYQMAYGFSNGLARVKRSGSRTYISPFDLPITGLVTKLLHQPEIIVQRIGGSNGGI